MIFKRYLWLFVLSTYYCASFFNDLTDQDTIITLCKVEKEKNPGLTQDYEGLIDTFNKRIVIDFKSATISPSVLKNIVLTIHRSSREIYPNPDYGVDLNGTVIFKLKTLKKEREWKISSCCLNTGSGPQLIYTSDWEYTMGVPGGNEDMGFGDGIIKADVSTEKLYLIGYKNIGIPDESYIHKINLTTGTKELEATLPWKIVSFGDQYLSSAFYVSLYDGANSYIRKVNTNTMNHTLEATLINYKNVQITSLPNINGIRVKGANLTATYDLNVFNVYNTTESSFIDCDTSTTETNPVFIDSDYSRETFFAIGISINCGAISSGSDIYISKWDNSYTPGLIWKRVLWSTNNDALPQIGFKKNLVVLPDGSIIVNRFYISGSPYMSPGKFDLNGNDITASTNFPNFPAYFFNRDLLLPAMTLYNYNNSRDLFYTAYNLTTGAYSIHRTDIDGNIRTITFLPNFSVGCNINQQTISIAVDSAYNLYFSCLKTNAITTKKEMYVKKFKATVVQ